MSPTEVWWLLEANKVEKTYGTLQMTESEARQIIEDLKTDVRFRHR